MMMAGSLRVMIRSGIVSRENASIERAKDIVVELGAQWAWRGNGGTARRGQLGPAAIGTRQCPVQWLVGRLVGENLGVRLLLF